MMHTNVGGIASVIYAVKEYASPRLSHPVCRHICACVMCVCYCVVVMTQLLCPRKLGSNFGPLPHLEHD